MWLEGRPGKNKIIAVVKVHAHIHLMKHHLKAVVQFPSLCPWTTTRGGTNAGRLSCMRIRYCRLVNYDHFYTDTQPTSRLKSRDVACALTDRLRVY